jgi:hypothetical protein
MIAVFLRGEIDSVRFRPEILAALQSHGATVDLLVAPDTDDSGENAVRRAVLDDTRGYARREGLFQGFPEDVRWEWVALSRDELAEVRFIDWSYWLELSGGTRRPSDAAARILAGIEAFGVSNDGFLELEAKLRGGAEFPALILVSSSEQGGDVVVEGHARLTAMALAPDAVPAEIDVLRGVSASMGRWGNYGA